MMRKVGGLAFVAAAMVATIGAASAQPTPDVNAACPGTTCGQLVYFGTRGDGIVAARFDPATGGLTGLGLVASVVNPTWLVASPHRPIVYSVSEVGNDGLTQASVISFAVDKRTAALTQISKVSSGGGGATHLEIVFRPPPPAILVSNYGSGQVAAIPLGPGGVLTGPSSVVAETGSGPNPRQQSAHPHGTAIDASGRFVFIADLGADRIFVDRFDPAGAKLSAFASVALPPGSGPRHVVAHPNGRIVYANAELTGAIATLRWDAAASTLALVATTPTRAKDFAGEISGAELALSADGRFLYVSNRGEDDLIVFAVDADSGGLREIQRLPSGGKAPVSFAFDPTGRWLAVANAGSDLISMFKSDPATGMLVATGKSLTVGKPASVAWLLH